MRFFMFGPRIAGIRTGLSFGREDLHLFTGQTRSGASASAIDPDHSFVYVIKGVNGLCKIGISSNPNARIAQLRSTLSFAMDFAWIGAPKGDTVAIEREAHAMLAKYRKPGSEWFAVAPDAAVGAVHAAAFRLGQPVLDLDAMQAEQIVQIAAQQPPAKSTVIGRVATGLLQLLAAFIVAGAVMVFVLFRLGRLF
jgi:Meiotically up-regulated gene 113